MSISRTEIECTYWDSDARALPALEVVDTDECEPFRQEHPRRCELRVFDLLDHEHYRSTREVAQARGIHRDTAGQHLRRLQDLGLVEHMTGVGRGYGAGRPESLWRRAQGAAATVRKMVRDE